MSGPLSAVAFPGFAGHIHSRGSSGRLEVESKPLLKTSAFTQASEEGS